MVKQAYALENPSDLLNFQKKRNLKNSDRWYYNCAGYALETFSWYCPYKNASTDPFRYGIINEEDFDSVTQRCVDFMLKDFPQMRVIEAVQEAKKNETIIAFRISSDGDFHFVKRNSNGHWFHKMGASSYIRTMKVKEVFSSQWCQRYDGPLVLFAKIKD